ncbi:MAG TPA: hypothetical protein VIS48_01255 [Candidatus Kryptonia bacterium]
MIVCAPKSMAGGGEDFQNFGLTIADAENDDGTYAVGTTKPSGPDRVRASIASTASPAQVIYISGYGVEIGSNNRQNVKAYAAVTPDAVQIYILN